MKDLIIGEMTGGNKIGLLFFSMLMNVMVIASVLAQELIPEKFWVHFDRPCYLSGETIWFKIYNINFTKLDDHSHIVYLNFHDKSGKLLNQLKLELNDGKANGSFDLPLTWQEDFYFVTCFTKWNLQFPGENLFVKKIAVYNPYESNLTINTFHDLPDSVSIYNVNNSFDNNMTLETDKPSYSRREPVRLRIESNQISNCSIAISTLEEYKMINFQGEKELTGIGYAPAHYSTKEKQITLEGWAKDPESGLAVTSNVLSLYKAGSNQFYRLTSKEGQIQNEMDTFYGGAVFQLFNMNPYQSELIEFQLKIDGEKLDGIVPNQPGPARNEMVNKYIKNARLRTKLDELFSEQKIDSIQARDFNPIDLKADKVYEMEKFKSMKTLEEFFKEIVFMVDLIKMDGKTTVRLKNTETQRFFMEKPWYLVDGYLTRDEEKVLNIPFKNLKLVEIFNTNTSILNQLESVMVRSGLIAIYTENYSLETNILHAPNIISFQGLTISKEFAVVSKIPLSEARENPEFDPLLYWNPNVDFKGDTTLQFITSDLQGEFIIQVLGFTQNGDRLFGTKIISVSN